MIVSIGRLAIANRGEIAIRIQRACRGLGITSIQLYSEADRGAHFVTSADERLCIGPSRAAGSYLNLERIVAAARLMRVDAVHPGYGFLSENAEFAARVEQAGLVFVGPPAPVIRRLGDKIGAKRAMLEAGVPCVPGYAGDALADPDALLTVAADVGYPLLVKAASGGGGRGMRQAASPEELPEAVATTREEARLAFGDATVYLERLLQTPRHVEIQVLADAEGGAVWLGERDCSLQRRHQKVMEEAPAPGIDRAEIAALGERCAEACRRIGYRGAGTFEFLYEDGSFNFIEVNARIQVEHPVTEAVTGIDLVEAQLRIAGGEPLWFDQAAIWLDGHAIECRINAEHPQTFAPSPGVIGRWLPPSGAGIRVDSHCVTGTAIPPFYDSLIGKVICHSTDRASAITLMEHALGRFEITGVETNIPMHKALLADPLVRRGGMDIHHLDKVLEPGR